MNKFVIISLILPFTLFCTTSSLAQTEAQTEIPVKVKGFINKLETKTNKLQGGAIAILHQGRVIYKKTFGHQKGNTKPITEQTLFPLASVSKAVSATAIALMVEQGRLSFDETFKIPYLENPISLINILSHTTGYQFSGNTQIEQGMSRSQLLNLLKAQKPSCKPGKCYQYSNATFSLVEEALNLKKLTLNSAIDNLCSSLQTQKIKLLTDNHANEELAYPHSKNMIKGKEVTRPLPFPAYYPKTTPASAGIFASIDGMIQVFKLSFGYRSDLISKRTLDRLFMPVQSNQDIFEWGMGWPLGRDLIESYYALGWRVLKVKNNPTKDFIFHSGYINGVRAFIGFIPSEEMGMIILTNQNSSFPLQSGINFWGEFLK